MSNSPVLTSQPLPAASRSLGLLHNKSSWRIFTISTTRNIIYRSSFPDPCISVPATAAAVSNTGTAYQTSGTFRVSLKAVSSSGAVRYTSRPISVISGPASRFGIQNPCFGSPTFFLDSSSIGNGFISSWNWDFGNGSGSVLRNPQFTYPDTGRYNIRLITTGNTGCADTVVKPLFITEKPQASFSFRSACQRDSAVFTDGSVFGFDPIVQWRWTLGGNLNSALQNPIFFPDTFGSIPVVLRVTNSGGCTDSVSQNLNLPAKPSIFWNARNTCLGDSVRFSNSSFVPGSSIVSNFWQLGDGNSSSDFSPAYTYADTGSYSVFYQATAANGCADSLRKTIIVSTPPVPDFSSDRVCQGSNSVFTDLSQPGSGPINRWFWDFGDGQTDTLPSPIHVYQNPGIYNVLLRVSSPTDCSDSISASLNVLPSPALSYSAGTACTGDSLIFVNSSSIPAPYQIVSWRWDLGNGDSSLLRDLIYRYDSAGFYNTSLTAISDSGCSARSELQLRVGAVPQAGFLQGLSCALTATSFTDLSFIPPTDTINSWSWDFGTGSGSTSRNPSTNFPAQGFYPVNLIVSTTAGCSDTLTDTVEVFGPLQAAIGVSGFCFGDSSHFEDLTASFSIVSRFWNFGDFSPPSAEASPSHYFAGPGTYAVTLSVQNAVGCQDTVTIPVSIQPKPTAGILAGTACLDRPVVFTSASQSQEPINRLLWSAGGNFYQGDSIALQFADTARREVRLFVSTPSGCSDSSSLFIQASAPPTASFSYNPLFGEAPLPVSFTNLSTGGNSYRWSFGEPNAISTDFSPAYRYEQNGEFQVSLIAQNTAGCSDTFTETLRVNPTTLDLLLDDLSYSITERNGVRELSYSIRLSNIGTRLIIQSKLQAETASGGSIAETWNGLLYPGQSTYYQFNSSFLQSTQQSSGWLCVEAPEVNFGSEDVNSSNNAVCRTLDNRIQLIGPYPNPSLGGPVYLDIILPKEESLQLGLFQTGGQVVVPISDLRLTEGKTSIRLPAESLRSGLYVLKIVFRDETLIRKLLLR
jgi:PKD repeat protein